MEVFYKVGEALAQVRDGKLYREKFATFEDYCCYRWQISRPRAYQLIQAAAVHENLSTNVDTQPTSEFQVRPLTTLAPEKQVEAWQEAIANAPAGKPTAKDVKAAVVERQYPKLYFDPPKKALSPIHPRGDAGRDTKCVLRGAPHGSPPGRLVLPYFTRLSRDTSYKAQPDKTPDKGFTLREMSAKCFPCTMITFLTRQ